VVNFGKFSHDQDESETLGSMLLSERLHRRISVWSLDAGDVAIQMTFLSLSCHRCPTKRQKKEITSEMMGWNNSIIVG
jgi:hypothetical protein